MPRLFVTARLVLVALVAQLSLAAVCDAMCATPAEAAPRRAATVAGAHAAHCQPAGSTSARAQAGRHVAPCPHESEPSARAAESRLAARHDPAAVSSAFVAVTPVVRGAPLPPLDPLRSPLSPRSDRRLVLRL